MLEIDVHGLTKVEARQRIDQALKNANKNIIMIRIIHGYQSGTALRQMIRSRYRKHPRVKRIELSMNPGITDLILN
ncbi:MAG: Smr/MutS family protein [Erysipelotrichaceae bacterium]|nr:Smr/MutS family protein [Erysipelotrichaceae bacterium]